MKSKRWIILLSISVTLFVIAYLLYPYFQKLVILELKHPSLITLQVGAVFRLRIIFALTFFFIPIFTGIINFLFQAKGKYNYYIYLSMLVSMVIFWQVRIYNLRGLLDQQNKTYGTIIQIQLPFEKMQIETFMFVGSMIGCIVAALILKRLQKKKLI